MATLDRLSPNIDHVGLNWSCWIDKWDILTDEDVLPSRSGGSKEEDSVDESRGSDTMTLSKEDMKIYGYCPARDNFYLVVCSHCGQLVKPQAFEAHCERRHVALTKLCGLSPSLADGQCPRPARTSTTPSSRERLKMVESQEAGSFSKPAFAPQHRTPKVLKEDTSSPSVKTSGPQEAPPSSPCPSPSYLRASPPRCHAPLAPAASVSSSSSSHSSATALEKRRTAGPSLRPGGPRTYSRTHKKVHKKECDLDKHCGVPDPARKTLCTRQLMCNIHSIHQRRSVEGRSRPFDQLASEQRTGSSGSDAEKLSAGVDSPVPAPHQDPPVPTPRQIKRTLGGARPVLWASREEGDGAVEVEIQPPYPFNQSLPSSGGEEEEGEREEEEEEEEEDIQEEENGDIPASPWHPKPLGICTFGSHTLGCSVFTFDRRLHHLRFALSAMMEQHANAHLWRRVPQVPAGRRTRYPTAPARRSSIKPRVSSSSGPPASSGPLGPRTNGQTLSGSRPPSAAGPHPARIPLGRPGRAPPRGRVSVAVVTQRSGRVEAPALIRTFPLREKTEQRRPAPPLRPPHLESAHGAARGPSDPGSPSPSNGWSRASGSDLRGPAQKRKLDTPPAHPRSSAPSHRHPPAPPPSSLSSWRKGPRVCTGPGD